MAIICPDCGREFDVTLFEYGHKIKCSCGNTLKFENIKHKDNYRFLKKLLLTIENEKKDKEFEKLKDNADRICSMIIDKRYKYVDISVAIEKFKKEFLEVFPEKENLYNMIYESRFKRLWGQFRDRKDYT